MALSKHKIGIIGFGALGGYFAYRLYLANYNPLLFIKNQSSQSLIVLSNDGSLFKTKIFSSQSSDNVEIEYLFVTVKSYSLENVLEEYSDIINNSKYIILVQSNINPLKYFCKNNIDNIYFAPVFIGVIGNYNSIIYELYKGKILLGPNVEGNSIAAEEIKALISLIAPTEMSKNIRFDLFVKVIINTSFIPLSIASCTSFGNAHKKKINRIFASEILFECIEIAKKEFTDSNVKILNYPLASIDFNLTIKIINELAKKYKRILPSVLMDILMEKEKTELPYYFEDIIELGKSHNSKTFHLEDAYKKLNYILSNNIKLQPANIELLMLNA